eukprot:1088871-Rhodomonas_salina.1
MAAAIVHVSTAIVQGQNGERWFARQYGLVRERLCKEERRRYNGGVPVLLLSRSRSSNVEFTACLHEMLPQYRDKHSDVCILAVR